MKTVLVVFGTRPEVIKMWPVVCHLRRSPVLKPLICVTAQHRQMLDQMLETFAITPDFDLDLMTDGQTLPDLTAEILKGVTKICCKCIPISFLSRGTRAAASAQHWRPSLRVFPSVTSKLVFAPEKNAALSPKK